MSLFSRIIVENVSEIDQLRKCCLQFFNAVSLLLSDMTPTVWTVGYAIPRHFRLIYEKYGVGLGINSTQGKEAKHVSLQQYARHSNLSGHWKNVLKHDYISSIWLRKLEPFYFAYSKSKQSLYQKESIVLDFVTVVFKKLMWKISACTVPLCYLGCRNYSY